MARSAPNIEMRLKKLNTGRAPFYAVLILETGMRDRICPNSTQREEQILQTKKAGDISPAQYKPNKRDDQNFMAMPAVTRSIL